MIGRENMKKILVLTLALLMIVGALCACGEKPAPQDDPVPVEEQVPQTEEIEVTADEQLQQAFTGLVPPEYAENVKYYVIKNAQPEVLPKIVFDIYDATWTYIAEPAKETAAYNFSGLDYEWTEELSCGIDEFNTDIKLCDKGGYIAWLDEENGIAYNIYSELSEMYAYSALSDDIYFANNPPEESSGDDGWTEVEPSGYDFFTTSIWKYDDEDSYIRVADNRTYQTADASLNTDGKVYFTELLDDTTIWLLDENGAQVKTLTAVKDENYTENRIVTLVDNDGRTLSEAKVALSGSYNCYVTHWYMEDGQLVLLEVVDMWYDDATVQALEVGSELQVPSDWYDPFTVTALNKVDDGTIIVNDTMQLTFDETAGLWKLTDHDLGWLCVAGYAELTDEMAFTDILDEGAHATLEECVEANGTMYITANVKDGKVVSVEATKLF